MSGEGECDESERDESERDESVRRVITAAVVWRK